MTMKKITVTNFDLEKAINENWNPEKFSIGDDILSIETFSGELLYELQLFAYWQNDNEVPDYFEMNVVRKIPFFYGTTHEIDYDVDILQSYLFEPEQYPVSNKLSLIHRLTFLLLDSISGDKKIADQQYSLKEDKPWSSNRILFYKTIHCESLLKDSDNASNNSVADLAANLMNHMEESGYEYHMLDFNEVDI